MADYYVKNGGNDGLAGTSDGAAWETLSKVRTEANAGTFNPGDRILLHSGHSFNESLGQLETAFSGSSGNYIEFDIYNGSARAEITGAYDLSLLSWGAASGLPNQREASTTGTNLFKRILTRDTGGGREFIFPADSGPQPITTATDGPDDTGTVTADYIGVIGDECIGKILIGSDKKWDRDAREITARAGNVATLAGEPKALDSASSAGNMMFIEGLLSQVESGNNNESYAIEDDLEIIRIKSSDSNPGSTASIQGMAYEHGVKVKGDYIKFNNLTFTHFWHAGIYVDSGAEYIEVHNCRFEFLYQTPFWIDRAFSTVPGLVFDDNQVLDICGGGVYLGGAIGASVRRNEFRRIADLKTGKHLGIPGDGGGGTNQLACAITMRGVSSGNFIEDNIIESIGYSGIHIPGTNHKVKRNFIKNVLQKLADGAAIYGFGNTNEQTGGHEIWDNVIIDAYGDLSEWKNDTEKPISAGIYMDNRVYGCSIKGNYISNKTGTLGIMLNINNRNHVVENNLVRVGVRTGPGESGKCYCLQIVNKYDNPYSTGGNIRTGGITVKNNTFVYLRPEGGYLNRFLNQANLTGGVRFDPRKQWDVTNYLQGEFSGNTYVMPYGTDIYESKEWGAPPDQVGDLAFLQSVVGDSGSVHNTTDWVYSDNATSQVQLPFMVNWPGEIVDNTFSGFYTTIAGDPVSSPINDTVLPDNTAMVIMQSSPLLALPLVVPTTVGIADLTQLHELVAQGLQAGSETAVVPLNLLHALVANGLEASTTTGNPALGVLGGAILIELNVDLGELMEGKQIRIGKNEEEVNAEIPANEQAEARITDPEESTEILPDAIQIKIRLK